MRALRQDGKGSSIERATDRLETKRCPDPEHIGQNPLPKTSEFFYQWTDKHTGRIVVQSRCKKCHNRKSNEYKKRTGAWKRTAENIKADSVRLEAKRKYKREWNKKELAKYPERVRARQKRWYDGMMQDPKRRALNAENARFRARAAAEREGREMQYRPNATKFYSFPNVDSLLPAAPLVPYVQRLNGHASEVAQAAGVDEAVLRRLAAGNKPKIRLSTADKICLTLGLNLRDLYPAEYERQT